MLRSWVGVALLAGSWMMGLNYFYPANPWAWFATVAVAVVMLSAGSARGCCRGTNSTAAIAGGHRGLAIAALLLLLPAVWYVMWPYRAAPLLIALGLLLRLAPLRRRWARCLAAGAIAAGVVMLVQLLALELYTECTARSHELLWPLPDALAGIGLLLGMDVSANGSSIAVHSMRQVRRLGATWELLLDPETFLFYVGGLTMLALWLATGEGIDEKRGAGASSTQESLPGEAQTALRPGFVAWIHGLGVLTLILLCWLPLRAALMAGLYMQRVLYADPERSLHAMNHFFSPWMLLLLLSPPVLLAWRFIRPSGGEKETNEEPDNLSTGGEACSSEPAAVAQPFDFQRGWTSPLITAGAIALAVFLFTSAIYWDPIGTRREGRVMVVERHSTWEPTTKPYDTAWFGELAGYNYAAIYGYLGQYYEMSRLLENDKIDDQTLATCDVLVIKTPTARYTSDEVSAVLRFVERGGGLLLVGDHTNFERSSTILNDIARRMGFIFRDDLLFSFNESPYDQLYVKPRAGHPIVQHLPPMDFAVSCSIDSGWSRGRSVITSTGLWSMGPEYHNDNFHPFPQHCPEMRYGAFVQVWAARQGEGRVVAFTDSTIFSNFCVFQPGKAEMMLGMIEWLNHGNPAMDPRPWLLLLGFVPLVAGLWMAFRLPSPFWRGAGGEGGTEMTDALTLTLSQRERGRPTASVCLVLLAAGTFGWVAASVAVAGAHRLEMPPPECARPERCVVIDRTTSDVPLSRGADTLGDGNGYGLLEQWIARVGCYTVRKDGPEAFSGDALVVICPSRLATEEFRREVADYVAGGGRLLVIDSPENTRSTANSLLWPFGLSIRRDQAFKGKLTTTTHVPAVEIAGANEVSGGQAVGTVGNVPVAATTKHGKGTVMAVGFGSLWSDSRMGEHWMLEPDADVKTRYDVLFSLLRLFLGDSSPTTPEKG
jgi:hypothetical protein